MNIGFLFAGKLPVELAGVFCGAVRQAIPSANLVQLTDAETPHLECADEVVRVPIEGEDLILWRCRHHKQMEGAWIVLDYDCWPQRNLTLLFAQNTFDIALTRRPEDDVTVSELIREHSPHNFGVIFQRERGRQFWQALEDIYSQSVHRDGWLGGQILAGQVLQKLSKQINCLELPGTYFNWTPKTKDEDVRARAVVHYKGFRKAWMLERGGYSAEDAERLGKLAEEPVHARMKQYRL